MFSLPFIAVKTTNNAVVADNQNHARPSRSSAMKKNKKSPTAWSVTKFCTRQQQLGRYTRPYKPGYCARHMNKSNRQTKTAGKASR